MRYLLFATAGTALFFAVYWCFMRRETRFQMVRWYLLGTLSLAMLLPLFRISVPAAVVEPVSAEEVEPLPQQRQVVGVSAGDSPSVGVAAAQPQAVPVVPYHVREQSPDRLANWVGRIAGCLFVGRGGDVGGVAGSFGGHLFAVAFAAWPFCRGRRGCPP